MAYLRVRGTREPTAAPPSIGPGGFEGVAVRPDTAIRPSSTRGEVEEVRVGEDQVVEVELEGGIRFWTTGDSLRELAAPGGTRGGREEALVLPSTLQVGPRSRGTGAWAIRLLKLLHVDLAEEITERVEVHLERQLHGTPGLYQWGPDGLAGAPLAGGAVLPGAAPVLCFLHGTASSTLGSFGGLREPAGLPLWKQLWGRYGENIFALEHDTLGLSPIENALAVARLLPRSGAVLHLVSHSRGGLVGELLCRGQAAGGRDPFDDRALARFQSDGEKRRRDVGALQELNELLLQKRPKVERFVRVACPARGTTLASGRLDLYLSVMLNVMGLIPGLRGSPVYDFVSALVLAVAKKRTDPASLPGLEAMMPTSPLVAVLNEPGFRVDADLSVVAGDTEGDGIFGKLKVLATDLFYRENHDLVVNTGSMVGGAERKEGAWFYFDKGSRVNHFHYFRNPATAERVVGALTMGAGRPGGFERITSTSAEELRTRAPAMVPGTRPVVFLLPGIMGSELGREKHRLWINPVALAEGCFSELAIEGPRLEAQGLVARSYAHLSAYLAATHEVVAFPFDWRRSVVEAAERLALAVASALEGSDHPVRLLAHSMGGLVARAMIARHPDLWKRVVQRDGGRLVMLGTPNGGSYSILRVLLGQERVVRYLALLDLRNSQEAILKEIARFPGILEMLPAKGADDYFGAELWQKWHGAAGAGWVAPPAAALAAARDLPELLGAAVDPQHMAYVAGRAPATPVGVELGQDRHGAESFRFLATAQGDGRVPWSTGRLPGVPTWYMDAVHGDLAAHPPAFPAIQELLERGSTALLPADPPALSRGADEVVPLPPDEIQVYPDAEELEAAALGVQPRGRTPREIEPPLQVAVVHGNLAFSRSPVAVGHYEGDTIAGAERALDKNLEHRLSQRRALGLYPGAIGTAEVFLTDGPRPRGAIVVGLGAVGELTPAKLERSFTHAALTYAVRLGERAGSADRRPCAVSLTTLLIGSGRGGISTDESVRAILAGTRRARALLRSLNGGHRVRIERLEFWELYEDIAIAAQRVLRVEARGGGQGGDIHLESELLSRTGGRRRAAFDEAPEWWDRLFVEADRSGGLLFRSLTDRARAENRSVPRQRALIDAFLRHATETVMDDRPELGGTLFELLVPNDLKDYAPERRKLVLVLDADSAQYPWELLRDPRVGAKEPLAVKTGLIRQLAGDTFRTRVDPPNGHYVLVIANPDTGKTFPDLPGARDEAEVVKDLLDGAGFEVRAEIETSFIPIVEALYAQPYRIIHVAAHGLYEAAPGQDCPVEAEDHTEPQMEGKLVIGKDAFLRPAEIDQLRDVPEVVFLNCCRLGETGPDPAANRFTPYPRLAANLAEQLIRIGVRAVVAAGWEVQDDAAETFARTFYQNLLAGRPFGDAVQAARRETFRSHGEFNTWGAYQCYGDPGFVLRSPSGPQYTPAAALDFSCPNELVIELSNLAQDAESSSQVGLRELRRRIDGITGAFADAPASADAPWIPARWLQLPEVLSALGRALGELGMYTEAIQRYEALLNASPATYTVQALEQLANLRTRAALAAWKRHAADGGAPPDPDPAVVIRAAVTDLENLPGGEPISGERRSLIGSAYKRLSQITGGEARVAALRSMEEAYRTAFRDEEDRRGRVDFYPLLNWLSAHVLLSQSGVDDPLDDFAGLLARAEAAATEQEKDGPDFWSRTAMGEVILVRALARLEVDPHAKEILAHFRAAWNTGGSVRRLLSVLEHLDWIIAILAGGRKTTKRAATLRSLHDIYDNLRAELTPGPFDH